MSKFGAALSLAILLLAPGAALAATQAAAVIDDGYAGKVLHKILSTGKFRISQTMELQLSLDDTGRLLECRASRGTDAKAVCDAAKAASPFGTPPYGVPTYVTLAFWSGQAQAVKQTADKSANTTEPAASTSKDNSSLNSWLAKVKKEIRDKMYIPAQTKPGTYRLTARIKCDSAGQIVDSSIVKGSGDAMLDKYALQGIKRAGKVTPPPHGAGDTFDLPFTLVRQ